jgi:2-polyprenyl-6-methoxyphenol hydroxylase-like FAD-dependent oxidoreductase
MARILIAGGSLGGLFAANILMRDGHDVLVLEKAADSLDGRGAGIVTHEALMVGLRRAGITIDETLGVQVMRRVALDIDGNTISELAMPQILTSWGRLYHLLHEALPAANYLQGVTVLSVNQDAQGVTVHCDENRSFTGDLLVASDGLRSVVRAQFASEVQPVYAGYVAWRGVCDETLLSRRTLDTIFDCFGFGLPAGEQLIGYPVAGAGNTTTRGKRRFNFVWYRPAPEDNGLAALLTDADGRHYPSGIPPNKVSWRAIAAMREDARRLLAPQFGEILEKTAQPFLQPIFDLSSAQIAFGRVALMGDASFVARPHVGMGVTKAAQDAGALSDCITRHGASTEAVNAYEAARLGPGQSVVQRSRNLGAYMQSQTMQQPGSPAILRSADKVVRETAVDLELYPDEEASNA